VVDPRDPPDREERIAQVWNGVHRPSLRPRQRHHEACESGDERDRDDYPSPPRDGIAPLEQRFLVERQRIPGARPHVGKLRRATDHPESHRSHDDGERHDAPRRSQRDAQRSQPDDRAAGDRDGSPGKEQQDDDEIGDHRGPRQSCEVGRRFRCHVAAGGHRAEYSIRDLGEAATDRDGKVTHGDSQRGA
jgi:hypothetical protein